MAKLQTVNIAKRVASKVADPTEQGAYNEQRATQQQLGQLNKVAQDFTTAQSNKQLETAAVQKSKSDADFEKKYAGKQSFNQEDLDELDLEGMGEDFPSATVMNEDGEWVQQDIPAHEVYPQMLEAHLKKSREAAGKHLSYDTLQSRWDANAQENENKMIAQAYEKADVDRHNFDVTTTNNNIDEQLELGNQEFALALAGNHPDIANRKAYQQQAKDKWDSQVDEQIDAAIANGDYAKAEELAGSINDPEKKSVTQSNTGKRVEKNAYAQSMIDEDPVEVAADLAHLKSDDYDGTLTELERKNQIQEMDSWQIARSAKANQQKSFKVGMLKSNLELRLADGDVSLAELDEFTWEHGPSNPKVVTPEWRTKKALEIQEVQQAKIRKEILMEKWTASQQGQGTFTGDSTENTEVLEEAYEINKEMTKGDPRAMLASVTKMAVTNRYIPEEVLSVYNGLRNANMPAEAMTGAIVQYRDIQNADASALQLIPNEDRLFAQEVDNLMSAGSDITSAVETVRLGQQVDAGTADLRKVQWQTYKKAGKSPLDLQEFMDSDNRMDGSSWNLFDNAPGLNDQIQADYEDQVQANLLISGNIKAATQTAYDTAIGNYGVSKTTGESKAMKYPPEKTLHMTTEQVMTEVETQLTLAGMPLKNRSNVELRSDTITGTDGQPSWAVVELNEFGQPLLVKNADGSPFRFSLQGEEYKKRSENLAKNEYNKDVGKLKKIQATRNEGATPRQSRANRGKAKRKAAESQQKVKDAQSRDTDMTF